MMTHPNVALVTAAFAVGLLKLGTVLDAGQQLSRDRSDGGLELILSTPMSPAAIVGGQAIALQRRYLTLAFLVLVFVVILYACAVLRASAEELSLPWHLAWLLGAAFFFWDLNAIHWVSLKSAMEAKGSLGVGIRSFEIGRAHV